MARQTKAEKDAALQKQHKELIEIFDGVTEADGAILIEAVIEDIWKRGLIPNEELFDVVVSKKAYRTLSDEQIQVLENPPPKVKRKALNTSSCFNSQGLCSVDFDIWNAKEKDVHGNQVNIVSDEDKNTISIELGETLFRLGKMSWEGDAAGFSPFRVDDAAKKSLLPFVGSDADERAGGKNLLSRHLRHRGGHLSPQVLEDVWQRFKNNSAVLGVPEKDLHGVDIGLPGISSAYNVVLKEKLEADGGVFTQWCTYYCDIKPDDSVPCPHTLETLGRMTEGAAVAAWIWGIYSKEYKGRQVPWIFGRAGEEGKSYFFRTIGVELFGEDKGFTAVSSTSTGKNQNNFTMNNFVKSVMILYPDCNNPAIIQTEFGKILSGGGRDSVQAEAKYKSAVTTTIEGRLMIVSNKEPTVAPDNWYLSRLMFCEIEPFKGAKDPNMDEKFRAEIPGFLAYAKRCYTELCSDNETIVLKSATNERVLDLLPMNDDFHQAKFEEHFVIEKGASLNVKKITNALEQIQSFRSQKDIRDFLDWLKKTGIKTERKAKRGTSFVDLRLRTLADGPLEDVQPAARLATFKEEDDDFFE